MKRPLHTPYELIMADEFISLDALVTEFAALWISGASPAMGQFLERVPEEQQAEAARLLIAIMMDGRRPISGLGRSKAESKLRPEFDGTLLSASDKADSNPASRENTANQSSTSLAPSQTIGPYKLLRKLGEGGMGEVWMAEQTQPVRRRVALKLIKKGMDNQQVIARFEAEKQALAMMDHQNIAKVLDAGTTTDGQPYFVMELVNGVPLTKYCDDSKLSIEQRLKLFMDVCAGVQHAHQKGIIHRDLKPGNILVSVQDDKSIPKVIDFGLAKATESTHRLTDQSLFTGIGQILGTLKYMSPEQASLDNLDIDTRTDIYALGVILYELLTGSTPLDDVSIKGLAALKVLEFIREKDPVKPSSKFSNSTAEEISIVIGQRKTDSGQLNRVLTRDLDWIVMKALDKDRIRRYESASGFAADIYRFLNNEPVIARPPSWSYLARKFVRKNRIGVIAGSLVALALIGGIAGTSIGMFQARQAQRDAVAARENEATQRKEAERSRELAESRRQEAEKNLAFARKGNRILGSIFADLNPDADYNEVSELRDALRSNLTLAIEELQGTAVGDPLEVAEMQHILGQSLAGLGEPQRALEVFESASATRKKLLGPDHPKAIMSMSELGATYESAGRFDEAVVLLEDALARCRSAFGPDHEDTLSNMNNLAMTYSALDRWKDAITMLEEALALSRAKHGDEGLETVGIASNLATNYYNIGLFDKALPLLEKVYAIRLASLGPDHPDSVMSLNNLAMIYQKTGDVAKALPLLEESLRFRKARFGPDHPRTFKAMNNLARVYGKLDQFEKARALYEESLKRSKSNLGSDHPDTLENMSNLAASYLDLKMIGEALPLLEDAYTRAKAKLGADHSTTLACMNILFRGYRDAKQPDKAAPILEEAFTLRKAKLGSDHEDTLYNMKHLAEYYETLGKHEQALPLFEQLFEIKKTKLGPDRSDTLNTMNDLAACYLAVGKLDEGLLLYEQALEIKKTKYGFDEKRTIDSMTRLGLAYLETGRPGQAVPVFEQALSLKKTKGVYADESTQRSMARLASAYMANDQVDKAVAMLEQVLESRKAAFGVEHRSTLDSMESLMDAYAKAGLAEKYRAILESFIALLRKSAPEDVPRLVTGLSSGGATLFQLKQFSEAEKFFRECLKVRQETQPDSWSTFNTQSMLGAVLLARSASVDGEIEKTKLLSEAESFLVNGYNGMQQREDSIPKDDSLRISEALDRLIELYTILEKPDEVRKYRELRGA